MNSFILWKSFSFCVATNAPILRAEQAMRMQFCVLFGTLEGRDFASGPMVI